MRILDRYIIRHFLSTFFLMVALFCVVAVVFDVAENLERLIDNDAPWGLVFGEYYPVSYTHLTLPTIYSV